MARLLPVLAFASSLAGCGGAGRAVESIGGKLTWTLDFDAEAEARGFSDCSYSRSYAGSTDRSLPWLCPDCDAIFRVESRLGNRSCFDQISEEEPAPVEWLGWSGTAFHRASVENFLLGELGEARRDGDRRTVSASLDPREISGGGSFTMEVGGTLKTGRGTGDPMWGLTPPDRPRCGWSRADAPAYVGDQTLRLGQPIPDGWFFDACGEGFRLYDQLDQYLVIEVSAEDCPPCQDMARTEEAFVAGARADGLDVSVVTLLAPSLSAVLDPTPTESLDDWADTFDLTMPVLADRGWGFWLGYEALGEGFGYPAVIVAAPDGRLMSLESGFAGWDRIHERIALDASGVGR